MIYDIITSQSQLSGQVIISITNHLSKVYEHQVLKLLLTVSGHKLDPEQYKATKT